MILALYGAGAMGREFRQIAEESGEWSGIVFIDDHAESGQLQGCPVYRFQMFRERFSPEEIRFAVAIGEPKFRRESFDRMIAMFPETPLSGTTPSWGIIPGWASTRSSAGIHRSAKTPLSGQAQC